jgi:hypothetical protein
MAAAGNLPEILAPKRISGTFLNPPKINGFLIYLKL